MRKVLPGADFLVRRLRWNRLLWCGVLVMVAVGNGWAAPAPDIRSVQPDLSVPEMTEGPPAPGRRVKQTAPGYENTEVYHTLYLPTDWESGGRYPVIVEYAGNKYGPDVHGDVCTGRVEDSTLGYGISAGKGFIWVCMPYLNGDGTRNVSTWWGDKDEYQVQPSIDYCTATVRYICDRYGGDPGAVILSGFSRGSIACNYVGLHDDEIAALWCAFVPYANYDGLHTGWPFPDCDRASARERLNRLNGRPQFICQEVMPENQQSRSLAAIRKMIEASGVQAPFTFMSTGFRNHNDVWILRPSPTRDALRAWVAACLDNPSPR